MEKCPRTWVWGACGTILPRPLVIWRNYFGNWQILSSWRDQRNGTSLSPIASARAINSSSGGIATVPKLIIRNRFCFFSVQSLQAACFIWIWWWQRRWRQWLSQKTQQTWNLGIEIICKLRRTIEFLIEVHYCSTSLWQDTSKFT